VRKRKTKNPYLVGLVRFRRRGGQPGNRNAATAIGTLSARVRDLKKRARLAIAFARARAGDGSAPEQP